MPTPARAEQAHQEPVTETQLVAESRDVLSRHARSFRWAGALLPGDRLDDAAVVYAFCRLVDDLADEAPEPEQARTDLGLVKRELLGQEPARPVVRRTIEVLETGGQSTAPALYLLEGVLSDLDPVLVQTDGELHQYCYRVAGTVGLMMCAVLGVGAREALPYAVDLGVGMQITNICRDVLEDARRGRVYLPAARLSVVGLSHERLLDAASSGGDPLTASERRQLASVVDALLLQADEYYTSAAHGMRYIPWRARLAIRVASRVYRAIGVKLRRHQASDPWAGRTWVPWTGKLVWTAVAIWDQIRDGFSQSAPHRPELHRHLRDLPGCQA